jgi:DNA-binding NtrC family response regulator
MNTENTAILIIEDDADVQRAARLVVQNHFHKVEILNSIDELEQALTGTTFDVVLLENPCIRPDVGRSADDCIRWGVVSGRCA